VSTVPVLVAIVNLNLFNTMLPIFLLTFIVLFDIISHHYLTIYTLQLAFQLLAANVFLLFMFLQLLIILNHCC